MYCSFDDDDVPSVISVISHKCNKLYLLTFQFLYEKKLYSCASPRAADNTQKNNSFFIPFENVRDTDEKLEQKIKEMYTFLNIRDDMRARWETGSEKPMTTTTMVAAYMSSLTCCIRYDS